MTHGNGCSEWEERWRSLRALENAWPDSLRPRLYGILDAQNRQHRDLVEDARHTEATRYLIDEALKLSTVVTDLIHGQTPSTFDDVYHLALFWRLEIDNRRGHSPEDRGTRWLYRGENKLFPRTTASLHRVTNGTAVDSFVRRLERFVDTASQEWAWLDERQLIALAQHYGGEPQVQLKTWLLDVTWDPYVALFFASYGWQAPDAAAKEWESVGRVRIINVNEFKEKFSGDSYIEAVRVPGFKRIRNQRALFIDAPDPSIVDDYSTEQQEFHQVPGLVFEDSGMSVTEEFLLDKDIDRHIMEWEKLSGPEVVVPRLSVPVRKRPENMPFAELARQSVQEKPTPRGRVPGTKREVIITLLAAMYERIRKDDAISHVGIDALYDSVRDAVSDLSSSGDVDIRSLMCVYRTHVTPYNSPRVEYWIDRAYDAWEKWKKDGLSSSFQFLGL